MTNLDNEPSSESAADAQTDAPWFEVRCEFPLRGRPRVPAIPWSQFSAALNLWRRSDYYDLAFFVRKPPGLRLRFQTRQSSVEFSGIVTRWLSELERVGTLIKHVPSFYEPEEYRFGGPEGMRIAHQLWTWDTELALEYESLAPTQRGSVRRGGLWAIFVNDLLKSTLEDPAEMWDVWCRLSEAFASLDDAGSAFEGYKHMAPNLFEMRDAFRALLSPQVRAILERVETGNRQTATALKHVSADGKLARGLRSWLTANALFQANRWGLGLEEGEPQAVTKALAQFLEPDRAVCSSVS